MHKLKQVLNWLVENGLFFPLVILLVFYLRWVQLTPPVSQEYATSADAGYDASGDYLVGFDLLGVYALLSLLWKRAGRHVKGRTVVFVLSIFFLGINGLYIFAFIPSVEDSAECGGATYFLTYHPYSLADDWPYYEFSRWDWSLKNEALFYQYAPGGLPSRVICDRKTNEVRLFNYNNHLMYFADRVQSYGYDGNFIRPNNKTYEIASYDLQGTRRYVTSVCPGEAADTCQVVPIEHYSPVVQDEQAALFTDGSSGEVYYLFDGRLFSSFMDRTRRFVTLSSVKTDLFTDKTSPRMYLDEYSIAAYPQRDVYVYILYLCDITTGSNYYPNTECYDLPFSYSTHELETARLVINKPEDQLSVLIGGKPVYIYKGVYDPKCSEGCADAVCLVDGCTVPKP